MWHLHCNKTKALIIWFVWGMCPVLWVGLCEGTVSHMLVNVLRTKSCGVLKERRNMQNEKSFLSWYTNPSYEVKLNEETLHLYKWYVNDIQQLIQQRSLTQIFYISKYIHCMNGNQWLVYWNVKSTRINLVVQLNFNIKRLRQCQVLTWQTTRWYHRWALGYLKYKGMKHTD